MTPPMGSEPRADHDDDAPVGRVLSRREALTLLGGVGAATLLAGCAPGASPTGRTTATGTRAATTPACVARPALTEGPYFVDERLNRSDIRSDPSDGSVKAGVSLRLVFNVSRVDGGCAPLAGATVDVWHCDALGVYSDVTDPGFSTVGRKFLRGYQATDASGAARFTTIYPGWYQGRTVHIHFKIRAGAGSGAAHEFTSQLFFDDALTDRVHAQAPYASKGRRTLRNDGGWHLPRRREPIAAQPRRGGAGLRGDVRHRAAIRLSRAARAERASARRRLGAGEEPTGRAQGALVAAIRAERAGPA